MTISVYEIPMTISVYEGHLAVSGRLLELSSAFQGKEAGVPTMWMPSWASTEEDWFRFALDFNYRVEHRLYSGSPVWLTNEGLARFNVPRFSFIPILVECPGTVFFFHQINSPDRGPILVWPYELFYDPTAIRLLCEHPCMPAVLKLLGYEVTDNGREDCVVTLTPDFLKGCRERVRRSWAVSKDTLVTHIVKPSYVRWHVWDTEILAASIETLAHNLSSIPGVQFDLNVLSSQDVGVAFGDVYDKWRANVYLVGSMVNLNLLACSTLFVDSPSKTCYWIGSVWRRDTYSDAYWGKTNRVTNTLVGVMTTLQSLGIEKFNLGINVYPYKHDFRPEIVTFPGFTSVGAPK